MTEQEAPTQVMGRDIAGNHSRVLFEGTREDAARFIQEHFPRLHVEPGSNSVPVPDAKLSSGEHWDGRDWHGGADDTADDTESEA